MLFLVLFAVCKTKGEWQLLVDLLGHISDPGTPEPVRADKKTLLATHSMVAKIRKPAESGSTTSLGKPDNYLANGEDVKVLQRQLKNGTKLIRQFCLQPLGQDSYKPLKG